ncbi:MAG TPA: hypothetical protein DDZ51_10525 [Planctomycetaceae bacterium]|nr:hypothetical protein [Planctomycetaceae bacterium]
MRVVTRLVTQTGKIENCQKEMFACNSRGLLALGRPFVVSGLKRSKLPPEGATAGLGQQPAGLSRYQPAGR